eukprot:4508862-Lingulodinium_polyedra.AAC.1
MAGSWSGRSSLDGGVVGPGDQARAAPSTLSLLTLPGVAEEPRRARVSSAGPQGTAGRPVGWARARRRI